MLFANFYSFLEEARSIEVHKYLFYKSVGNVDNTARTQTLQELQVISFPFSHFTFQSSRPFPFSLATLFLFLLLLPS